MKKRLFALLAIVLAVTTMLSGCVLYDTQTDALAETENWYLPLNSYAYNGTSWVRLPGAGGGGGGGLWETDGGDAELIIPDSLDIQSQFIHNVLDPVLNQDAATKLYVDNADTTLANDIATNATAIATNAAAIAVNVGNIATNTINIATNTADIASNATVTATNTVNIATNMADIASNVSAITVNAANIATNTADIASNVSMISTNTANIATNTADIASNVSAITTNAADIASNATQIATNTANIATNTADIASNATQIATNTADIASNATAFADHSARHESGGADEIEVTYDICESYIAAYIMSRSLTRYMHIQFDSYDMIDEYTGGTGYTVKNFYAPYVRSGATSGGWAVLCQNAEWLYVDRDTIFYQQGYYVSATRDGTGFIGITDSDNHVIAKDDTVNHAGFVFYVSGATQTVYAQSGDTVACEQTDLSVDPATFASWAMICDGSHIYFYRNWALVATHTTRIPSGALAWKISTISAENQDNAIVARNFIYGQIS